MGLQMPAHLVRVCSAFTVVYRVSCSLACYRVGSNNLGPSGALSIASALQFVPELKKLGYLVCLLYSACAVM